MADRRDPVDRALEQIRSSTWTGSTRNSRIEEAIMNAHTNRRPSRRTQLIAVGVVLFGAGVVAAALTGLYPRSGRPAPGVQQPARDDASPPDDARIEAPADEFKGATPSTAGS